MNFEILKPTLVLDKNKCFQNINRMCEKSHKHNLIFRPHFKTHQSAEIGNWFRDFGVSKITVSSVRMASYFFRNGWKDITIAFPFNIHEINELNYLTSNSSINILLADEPTLEFLRENLTEKVGVFLKIDTGLHRSGITSENIDKISLMINKIQNNSLLLFKGFLTHAGHTYHAKTKEEILAIFEDTRKKLGKLKKVFKHKNDKIIISIGDTPGCSLSDSFEGIDEIRPGNFVFYDIMQQNLGSCDFNQIAISLACPVVSKNKSRNEIVIYGGAIHLSKEYIKIESKKIFGWVVKYNENSWSESLKEVFVSNLSQEHGIIKCSKKEFDKVQIGDILGILPVHSCLTANLMKEYFTFEGDKIGMM